MDRELRIDGDSTQKSTRIRVRIAKAGTGRRRLPILIGCEHVILVDSTFISRWPIVWTSNPFGMMWKQNTEERIGVKASGSTIVLGRN